MNSSHRLGNNPSLWEISIAAFTIFGATAAAFLLLLASAFAENPPRVEPSAVVNVLHVEGDTDL
jgi:hypothetical protein